MERRSAGSIDLAALIARPAPAPSADRVHELAAAARLRLVMSESDWTMTATQLEVASPIWPTPPKRNPERDLCIQDGDVLRQGDAAVALYVAPGHPLGTVSPVFEVRSGERRWKVLPSNHPANDPTVAAGCAKANRVRCQMMP